MDYLIAQQIGKNFSIAVENHLKYHNNYKRIIELLWLIKKIIGDCVIYIISIYITERKLFLPNDIRHFMSFFERKFIFQLFSNSIKFRELSDINYVTILLYPFEIVNSNKNHITIRFNEQYITINLYNHQFYHQTNRSDLIIT
jgi:hypothetical protein